MNARVSLVAAVHEIAISTELAITARPSEKANTHALTNRPALDPRAKRIDSPDNFMPWHAGPANWKDAFYRARIRVTYSTCFDAHAYLPVFWFTNRKFDQPQFVWFSYLNCFVSSHVRCAVACGPLFPPISGTFVFLIGLFIAFSNFRSASLLQSSFIDVR
jgi:hypothetical protein